MTPLFYITIGIFIGVVATLIVQQSSLPDPPENVTDEDIRKVARLGQKIQAIKWYKSLHNVGLKDAKEAVEKMIGEDDLA